MPNNQIKIVLKPGKEQSLQRFHPWIFSGAIQRIDGQPDEGSVVQVVDSQDHFLAVGHYQTGSISVRILSFEPVEIDKQFWHNKLARALDLRHLLHPAHNGNTTCYRLVHGEGDGLPGLIIDIYGATAVMQCHSVGMYKTRQTIANELLTLMGGTLSGVYDKSSGTVPWRERLHPTDGFVAGTGQTSAIVLENGYQFRVSWADGQKTGFYLDQGPNRLLLQRYAEGKSVLNTFAYTGGFSVYALGGGASQVVSVDSSERALQLASDNVTLNFGPTAPHQAIACDTFEFLRTHTQQFDIVVVDPPAFAKHNSSLHNALQAYKRLNLAAIRRVKPKGLLFTFSCSQVVSRLQFRNAVFSACAISGRPAAIVHQLSQPADHPVNIYHPEGEYLKGLVIRLL